jgi:hypothetical protein
MSRRYFLDAISEVIVAMLNLEVAKIAATLQHLALDVKLKPLFLLPPNGR